MGAIGPARTSGRPDAPFPALRRFFEALARRQPLAVIFEDVHWAQPTLLDLIEYLAEWTRQAVFLLCLARPELLEERGTWGGSKPNADVACPGATGPGRYREAYRRPTWRDETLLTGHGVRVAETSQGNPLFVEQLLAALEGEREPCGPCLPCKRCSPPASIVWDPPSAISFGRPR